MLLFKFENERLNNMDEFLDVIANFSHLLRPEKPCILREAESVEHRHTPHVCKLTNKLSYTQTHTYVCTHTCAYIHIYTDMKIHTYARIATRINICLLIFITHTYIPI